MKREKSRLRTNLGTALFALTVFATNTATSTANTPPASIQLLRLALADNALTLTYRLLNESSAAKDVLASNDAEVKALHAKAMAFYEQAAAADRRGETESRDQALLQAKTTLLKAAQLTRQTSGLDEQRHSLYQRRAQSAEALLGAHKRIREELKSGAGAEALENKAIADIAAANARYEKGDVTTATQRIDQALTALKGSLIKLRNGSTLVRTLQFDNAKEEYEYELERNQSHTLLSNIFLQQEPLLKQARQRFDKDMETAKTLRQQAAALATKGEYGEAIEILQESSRHIVHAIRVARSHTST